ncbi:MAG: hypothetical protein IJT87_05350 [Ruminiclostridium sp.]|nr:hypothetical protein [Ruminiclostridium sp.]
MKILSLILKIAETLLVCVWGVAVGIFFPLLILVCGSEIVEPDIAARTDIMAVWIVTSTVGYVLPAALIFGKHYRVAAGLSFAGLVGVLIVNGMFEQLFIYTEGTTGPDELYLPLIFATLLDIAILAIEERHNIAKLFEDTSRKKEEKAPSIFEDSPESSVNQNTRRKK